MKLKTISVLAVASISLSGLNATAQKLLEKNKLDNLLQSFQSGNKALTSVAVIADGKNIYSKAYGYSKTNGVHLVSANASTKYRIGSISKLFTSVMIYQLIEENKLSLNTCLSSYFPQIPKSEIITIDDLLKNQSGIPSLAEDADYSSYYAAPATKESTIEKLNSLQPEFFPAQKVSYSNSNYILLGYIIEHITQKPYNQEIKERIINRIDLKGADLTLAGNNAGEAAVYEYNGGSWNQNADKQQHKLAGIYATPTAMDRFIKALFNGKLIDKTSLARLLPNKNGISSGIEKVVYNDVTGYGLTSNIDGHQSMLVYFPASSTAVSIMSNGLTCDFKEVSDGVLDITLKNSYQVTAYSAKKNNHRVL